MTVESLLLDLVNLLARLLLALVEVAEDDNAAISNDLDLGADEDKAVLHQAVLSLGLAVLIVPGALDVGVRRQSKFLELGGLFLDDWQTGLDLGKGVIADLVGLV